MSEYLDGICETAYDNSAWHIYTIANEYWFRDKHLKTLQILNEAFAPKWEAGRVNIPLNNSFWQATSRQREFILNFIGVAYSFFGMCDLASACFLQAADTAEDLHSKTLEYSNYLFNLHYMAISPEKYFQVHTGYNDFVLSLPQLPYDKNTLRARYRKRGKIRLGYISPDLRKHVVLLFIWVMLTKYNRDEFEIYLFSSAKQEDEYSDFLKSQVQLWCDISELLPEQAAMLIYNQQIDILIDLAGHSKGNSLQALAYKPAPIQVSGIGYFATTGLATVDYFLTDKYLINEESQKYFTEKLLILPRSHFCYTPLKKVPAVTTAPCIKKGYITFGSFNNMTKVNDKVLETWVKILQRVPNAHLLLKCAKLSDEDFRELTYNRLCEAGISPERFELRGYSTDYLQEYYDVDIALDTFPYPGGGTTCDALYMGVPVVTYGDGSHGGSFGVSLLKNIGLDFACAESLDEYVDKAVVLAQDIGLVNALHLGLREMMKASPVMDTNMYMQDLELAYRNIWEDYLA